MWRAAAAWAVLAAATCAAAALGAPPPTARCADGSLSYAAHHSGACSHHGGVAQWLDGGAAATGGTQISVGPTVLLGVQTAHTGCSRGILPDRRCSPGAYSAGLTRSVLCAAGFHTSTIRDVSDAVRFAVEREYGLPARHYGRAIEIDHIVPLELGGSNSIANLFPEPGSGAASYHAKDGLENRLHSLVCAGRIGLREAQGRIAANWQQLYRAIFGSPRP